MDLTTNRYSSQFRMDNARKTEIQDRVIITNLLTKNVIYVGSAAEFRKLVKAPASLSIQDVLKEYNQTHPGMKAKFELY